MARRSIWKRTNEMSPYITDELMLDEASAIRRPDGSRRYASTNTLRRRIKNGSLPHTLRDGAFWVTKAALDAAYPENGSEELERWLDAFVAGLAPLDTATADRLVSIVEGARAA